MQGRKHRTLLPSLTDSLAIEENLKCKLNKFAFDEVGRKSSSKTMPLIDPLPFRTSLPSIIRPVLAPATLPDIHMDSSCPSSRGSTSGSESLGPSSSPVPPKIRKRRDTGSSSSSSSSSISSNYSSFGSERRHVCRICYKGFTTSGHLARHNRIHTGERNHECPYQGCEQKFSRHDNCIQHYRTHLKRELRASEALRAGGNAAVNGSTVNI